MSVRRRQLMVVVVRKRPSAGVGRRHGRGGGMFGFHMRQSIIWNDGDEGAPPTCDGSGKGLPDARVAFGADLRHNARAPQSLYGD